MVDNTGPAAAAGAAGPYSILQAVLSAQDMGSLQDVGSVRNIAVVTGAEALRPRTRMSVCGRGNGSFFDQQSGDGGGGDVRVLLLLLRGVRALLCAWRVRGGGSLLLRVRGRRR